MSEQGEQATAAGPFDQQALSRALTQALTQALSQASDGTPGQASQAAGEAPAPRGRRGRAFRLKHRRRWIAVTAAVVVIGGGGAAVYVTKPFQGTPASSASPAAGSGDATGLQPVTTTSLSETTQASGTLGYAGSYTVVVPTSGSSSPGGGSQQQSSGAPSGGSSGGTFTALPAAGAVVAQGQSVYAVSGLPVPLLYGSVPAYRTLSQGMTGTDVKQLNADLVTLGYATTSELDPGSDSFSPATATALKKLQSHYGLPQTGTLPLGQAVFQPTALTVSGVSATLGQPAQAGAAVLQATSTTRQVVAQVDANQETDVAPGAQVSIVLPDSQTTPGVVTSISTTANAPSGSSSSSPGSSSNPSSSTDTLNVDIKMTDPSAAGSIAQAPVQVNITTQSVHNVLAVPIDALITEPSGYDVEVAAADGSRHLVRVSLGLFDDTAGLVQVSGSLKAGQQVVVPQL